MANELRRANMLKMHDLGMTWEEIGEPFNLSRSQAYRYAHPESLLNTYRRTTLGVYNNGKLKLLTGLHKRPYTGMCEICGKDMPKKLAYHHWIKSNPNLGLWLCYTCHMTAETIDYIPGFVQLYEKTKRVALEEVSVQMPGNFIYNCQMNFFRRIDELIHKANNPIRPDEQTELQFASMVKLAIERAFNHATWELQYSFNHSKPVAQYNFTPVKQVAQYT